MFKLKIIFILIITLFILIYNKYYEKFTNNNLKKKSSHLYYSDEINIILSCDKNQFPGLLATINSICKYAKNNYSIINFYFLVDKKEKKILQEIIESKFPLKIKYKIKEIKEDLTITKNIRVVNNKYSNTANIMNFARFTFQEEFPNLDKILYIDADIIIKDDITKLYRKCDISKNPFYAVSDTSFGEIKDINNSNLYKANAKYFNAGLYITSLEYWRKNNIKSKCIQIMKAHKKSDKGLFKMGTQPILNIIFYEKFSVIPREWNTRNLGYKKISTSLIKKAKGLHWNGKNKPWLENGNYKNLWLPYKLI